MGQQQLLYILLGIIIIGIAIAVSMALFRHNAVESKRDILINEGMNLATLAMNYYRMPTNFGGGGHRFTGWHIPNKLLVTENGSYQAQINDDNIVLSGTGNEIVTGGDSIRVKLTVFPDSVATEIIN